MSLSDPALSDLVCRYPGCKSSGRIFKRPYELTRHELIHFPNKKLSCPVQGCKLRKRGKFHTRDDKFREHLNAHGELALWCCPLPGCNFQPVPKEVLDLHVGNNHDVLEQERVITTLDSLRMGYDHGHWSCIFRCGVEGNGKGKLRDHLRTHDLSERMKAEATFKVLRISVSYGKVTCPICKLEFDEWSRSLKLCDHLEISHLSLDLAAHRGKLAELLIPNHLYDIFMRHPKLYGVLCDSTWSYIEYPSTTASDLASPFVVGISGGPSDSTSSPNDGPWNVHQESIASTDSFHFQGCGGTTAEQLWLTNASVPQQSAMPQSGFSTPCPIMPLHMVLPHHTFMLQGSLLLPESSMQPLPWWPQQEVMQQQSYTMLLDTKQPQQSVAPDTPQASLATSGAASMNQNIEMFEYLQDCGQDWSTVNHQPIFQPVQQFQSPILFHENDMTVYGPHNEQLATRSWTLSPQNMAFQQPMNFDINAHQYEEESRGPQNRG